MVEIYNDDKHIIAAYNQKLHYLINIWIDMSISVEDMKKLQERNYAVIEENGIESVVVDITTAKGIAKHDTLEYYATVIEPRLIALGIKRITTISSKNTITNATNKKWQDATKTIAIDRVNSLKEAEELIQKAKLN